MSVFQLTDPNKPVIWDRPRLFLLKFITVFFLILSIPLDWKFYRDLFSIPWEGFHFVYLFEITRYFPRFLGGVPLIWDVAIVTFLAVVGAMLWSRYVRETVHPDKVYYYVRVIVRYRLAAVLLAYGFVKIFPVLAPYPSITLLNTPYGDLSAWKIFNLSIGIVPDYQVFLAIFEVLAAILLLNRKTAGIGAFIALLFLGNVAMSNLAYEGVEFVFSGTLALFAAFVFAHDLPKLITLIVKRGKTYPDSYFIGFNPRVSVNKRIAKYSFIAVFLVLYGSLVYVGHSDRISRYPQSAGLPGMAGIYDVTLFIQEGDTIPYGSDFPDRWNQVVFEEWATVAIKRNRVTAAVKDHPTYFFVHQRDRTFEVEGIQGWQFFEYKWESDGSGLLFTDKYSEKTSDPLDLKMSFRNNSLVLKGRDAAGKQLEAVLVKRDKKYLLEEASKVGRRSKLKL